MSEWEKKRLGDLINIKHGYAFKGEYFSEDGPGPLLLTPGNFAIGGGFKENKPKYYLGSVPDEFKLKPGDLVVTMTDLSKAGDTLGYPAIIPFGPEYLHNQRTGLVSVKSFDEIDKLFLFYALRTLEYRGHVLAGATGSTVRHTSPGRISEYEISVPGLKKQRAIAAVLGALDDKIAVDGRITVTYELLLRTGFEELRIDEYPESSSVISASEIVEFNPTIQVPRSGDAVYLDMAAVPTDRATVLEWSRREPKSGTRFANGDTVMARITPCLENGKTAFIDFMKDGEVGIGSTEFIVMRARPGIPAHLPYFLARSARFRTYAVQNMVGSSGRQRVNAVQLVDFPLGQPDSENLSKFGAAACKAFAHMRSLTDESRSLAELRDTLLPKLMSGEIRVQDAEKVVEDVT